MTQNNEEYKDINLKMYYSYGSLRHLVRNFTNRRQIIFQPKHEARILLRLSLFSIMGSHYTCHLNTRVSARGIQALIN